MTTKERFTAEEWEILSALPSQAAIAAAVSDGVTLIGTVREINEGMAALEAGATAYAGNELILAILDEMTEQAQEVEEVDRMVGEGGAPPPPEDDVEDLPIDATEPMTETTTDFAEEVVTTASPTDAVAALEAPEVDPRDPNGFLHEVVANATQAREILAAKSTPDEAGSYKAWVIDIVDRVINRTRSGGFLGIGGERVDDEERKFRSELAAALAASS
jgi:hypothetical protein